MVIGKGGRMGSCIGHPRSAACHEKPWGVPCPSQVRCSPSGGARHQGRSGAWGMRAGGQRVAPGWPLQDP